MNSGAAASPLILSTATFSVPATSGFVGLLNLMWLSLICTKLNSPIMFAVLIDNFHVFEDKVEQEVQYSSSENAPISHELGSLTLSRGAERSGPHKPSAPGSLIARK
jgi:hypothetical protein